MISWQERYANVETQGGNLASSQFISSAEFLDYGRPSFSPSVERVGPNGQPSSPEELDRALSRLRPGQYAIVAFSVSSGCPACITYAPDFERMAQQTGGQYLFLKYDSWEIPERFDEQVVGLPTVLIIDHRGGVRVVTDRDNVLHELTQFNLSISDRYELALRNLRSDNADSRLDACQQIVFLSDQLEQENINTLIPILRQIVENPYESDFVCSEAVRAYCNLLFNLNPEEVESHLPFLRNLFNHENVSIRRSALTSYHALIYYFIANGSTLNPEEASATIAPFLGLINSQDESIAEYSIETLTNLFILQDREFIDNPENQWETICRVFREGMINRNLSNNIREAMISFFANMRGIFNQSEAVTVAPLLRQIFTSEDEPDSLRSESLYAYSCLLPSMNESEMRAALPVLTPLITSNNDDICSEAIGCIERITDVIQPSEALAIAVGLRNLFEHTNPEIRYTALSTYVGLLSRFNNSLEAENERHSGIVAIRHLFSDPDQRVAEFAIDHYVTTLYAVPSPQWQIREANQGARCLREALATGHADFNRNITRNYFELVRTPFFQNQRNEIITCMRLTENPDPDIRGNALELLDYLIDLNLEHGIVSPVFARFRAVYEDPNENDSVRIIAARNFFPHLARLSESERMEVLASTRRICLNSELSNEARGAIGWIYTNGLLDELDSGEAFSEAQTLRQSFNNSNPEVVSWAVLAYRDLFDRLPPDELILAIQALNGALSTEDDNLILISYLEFFMQDLSSHSDPRVSHAAQDALARLRRS